MSWSHPLTGFHRPGWVPSTAGLPQRRELLGGSEPPVTGDIQEEVGRVTWRGERGHEDAKGRLGFGVRPCWV